MVLDGWRFGFVVLQTCANAKEHTRESRGDPRTHEFIREYRKMLHALQTIHHTEEIHLDVAAAVFDQGLDQAARVAVPAWQTPPAALPLDGDGVSLSPLHVRGAAHTF